MKISRTKTEYMLTNLEEDDRQNIRMNREQLKIIVNFKYIGFLVNDD